ncbi:N-6 DNA methylase [bacterium]|nr:N-6 DNA methylase [bacterium]
MTLDRCSGSLSLFLFVASESFFHRETQPLFKQLEEVSQRSGISRGQSFEDFLHVSVCALAHPTMEDEYLQTIERHKDGVKGRRGVDKLAEMFATMVDAIDRTRDDILGDLFQGSITYGEKGQFLTPMPICRLMAQMNIPEEKTGLDGRRSVNDPAVGSGRMLLAAAEIQPNWHFVGQDIDLRCVRMTAINLGLRNHYGHVVQADTLRNTQGLIYETGRVEVWGNAIRKVSRVPLPDRKPERIDVTPPPVDQNTTSPLEDAGPTKQLEFF